VDERVAAHRLLYTELCKLDEGERPVVDILTRKLKTEKRHSCVRRGSEDECSVRLSPSLCLSLPLCLSLLLFLSLERLLAGFCADVSANEK